MAKNEITEKGLEAQKAYKEMLDWLTMEAKNVPAEVLEAAKIIRPSYFGLGGFGVREGDGLKPAYRNLMKLFDGKLPEAGESFTLTDAFQKLRFGTKEVARMIRYLIKEPIASSPIVWIAQNGEEYIVEAVQNEVPEGWDKALPIAYTRAFGTEDAE